MIAQLKSAASKPQTADNVDGIIAPTAPGATSSVAKVNFADALKSSLDSVSAGQIKADNMGKAFTAGDDTVSLSDTMIAMQKSGIEFQATIQVRNKLVAAYHEIMNMQV